jgi:hypothetical protein
VSTSSGLLRGVPAEIFLPKTVTDAVRVRLHPSDKQVHILQASSSFRLAGRTKQSGYTYEYEAGEVWRKPFWTAWGHGINVHSEVSGEAKTLRVSRFERRKPVNIQFNWGTFRLTAHNLVNVDAMVVKSYTGTVRIRRVAEPIFTIRGVPLRFRNHYRHTDHPDGSWTTSSELVAEFGPLSKPLRGIEIDGVLRELDDWLLLASVAARHRCICTGYDVSGPNAWVQFFRRNLVVPEAKQFSFHDSLVDIRDFWPFMRASYRKFLNFPEKELLRGALYPLLSRDGYTSQASFKSLFSALESLLKFIGRMISQNRPFGTLFELANQIYKFPLSDLWPLFDNNRGKSLVDIRNSVVHGDYLSPAQEMALSYAEEHLQWTIERVLLALFAWDLNRSLVNPDSLKNWFAYHEWDRQISAF